MRPSDNLLTCWHVECCQRKAMFCLAMSMFQLVTLSVCMQSCTNQSHHVYILSNWDLDMYPLNPDTLVSRSRYTRCLNTCAVISDLVICFVMPRPAPLCIIQTVIFTIISWNDTSSHHFTLALNKTSVELLVLVPELTTLHIQPSNQNFYKDDGLLLASTVIISTIICR